MRDPPVSGGGRSYEPQLLEREGELAQLVALLESAVGGDGGIATIEGPAGIGKSSLLAAVAAAARARGCTVTVGRGGELEQELAWRAVRDLFEPLAASRPTGADGKPSQATALAAPVLEAGDSRLVGSAGEAVGAALHGLYWLAVELALERPLVVAVDDLHWVDAASLRWLAYLAARLEGLPILIVLAARTSQCSPEALELLSRGTVIRPPPLGVASCGRLVRTSLGDHAADEFCAACSAATAGNPLLLRQLAGALAADGIAPTAENAGVVLDVRPATVARSALARLAGLSPAAVNLASAVAVLGVRAGLQDAAAVAGVDDDEIVGAVEALVAADVLADELPLTFAHPIVRRATYDGLSAARRAHLHERAAAVLERRAAGSDEIAGHLVAAPPRGDASVVEQLMAASEGALARGAPEAAVAYMRRALEEPPPGPLRARVLRLLGRAHAVVEPGPGFATLREAFAASAEPAERAEIALEHARAVRVSADLEAAIPLLQRSIAELDPDSSLKYRLEAELVNIGMLGSATLEQARMLLTGWSGDRRALSEPAVLACLALASATQPRSAGEAVELANRALQRLDSDPNTSTFTYAAIVLVFADELERGQELWKGFVADARRAGSALAYAHGASLLSDAEFRAGALAAAESDARSGYDVATEHGQAAPEALSFVVQALIDRDLDAAAAVLDSYPLVEEPADFAHGRLLYERGRLRIATGNPREGVQEVLRCGALLESWPARNPAVIPWRSTAALGLAAMGEAERARELAREELGYSRTFGTRRSLGISLRAAGLVEGGDAGIELLREASELLCESPARLEAARALCDLGAALRRRGNRRDCQRPLRDALAGAAECDGTVLRNRARAELVSAGARPRRDELHGRDALTSAELRVAQMAADGRSNREIAQDLFVTLRTVETHLTHVYQKLDISSRTALGDALHAQANR